MVVDIIKPPTIDAIVVDHPKNAHTASNHACRVQKLNRSIEYTHPPHSSYIIVRIKYDVETTTIF